MCSDILLGRVFRSCVSMEVIVSCLPSGGKCASFWRSFLSCVWMKAIVSCLPSGWKCASGSDMWVVKVVISNLCLDGGNC